MPLSETLAKLDQLAARLRSDCGQNGLAHINHKFKIGVYASSLVERKQSKPNSKIALDLVSIWKRYCETFDTSLINLRTFRLLACAEEMYSDSRFIDFVCTQKALPANTLRATVAGCLTSWQRFGSHERLRLFLESAVLTYAGRDHKISYWKERSNCLLSHDAPSRFAAYAVSQRLGIRESFEHFGLDSYLGTFSKLVAEALIAEISSELRRSLVFDQQLWNYIYSTYIIRKDISKGHQCQVLSEVILAVDRRRTGGGWQDARTQLIDFILESKDFGDPRARKSAWADISPEAQKRFISWLSEKDLAFFFELIIDHDPHNRKNFWMAYVNSVHDSRIVLCEQDQYKHASLLRQQKGQRFSAGKLKNATTSAFILDFGKYVVVEFSRIKNACYIYEKDTFDRTVGGIFQNDFTISKLKNEDVKTTQSHYQGWEVALRPVLAELGIRPS